MNKLSTLLVTAIFVLCLPNLSNLYADGLKDRYFELGFNMGFGISNNLVTVGDIFRERVVVDLDNLGGDLNLYSDFNITPFYFLIRNGKDGSFGVSSNLDYFGISGFSEKMLLFNEAEIEKSELSYAVFSDFTLDFGFKIDKFKIKINPSVYYPIVYSKTNIEYTFNTIDTSLLYINYDMRIHTALKIDDVDNVKYNLDLLSANPGIDFSIGLEYPLSETLGINKRFVLFDFNIGIDFINIPITASSMNHYIQLMGFINMEGEKLDEFLDIDEDNLSSDPEYGKKNINIYRPFRTMLKINWSPLESSMFTIIPQIGFSINALYAQPFSMEYGIKTEIDCKNIVIFTIGTCYEDRFWHTGINTAFNLRVFEFNLGIDLKSAKFFNVANTSGFGFNLGIKFGW